MRSKSLNYMPALDGMRAVAVLMVFFIHAFPGSSFPGTLGVDVFFVLSGFLITLLLVRELDRDGTIRLRRFYAKRLLRLYPALLAMVTGMLVLDVLRFYHVPWQRAEYGAVALAYVSNLYLSFVGRMEPFSHTWSLAQEEQFYLVWPAMLLVMHRLGMRTTRIATVVAVLAGASLIGWAFTSDVLYNPLTRAGGLFTGCVVALLVAKRPWHNAWMGHLALVGIVLVFALDTADMFDDAVSLPLVTLLLPFVMLLAAYGRSPVNRVLSVAPMRHLGVISYAFYLWHYPILIVLGSWGYTGIKGAAGALALTLIASEISYWAIEAPTLRLKDRVGAPKGGRGSEVRDDDHNTRSSGAAST